MLSATGETLFDRFAVRTSLRPSARSACPERREAFFVGEGSRVTKLAHGIHVSDIIVNKPSTAATATFTVTLSGFIHGRGYTPSRYGELQDYAGQRQGGA